MLYTEVINSSMHLYVHIHKELLKQAVDEKQITSLS